jgi:hypothetical protein
MEGDMKSLMLFSSLLITLALDADPINDTMQNQRTELQSMMSSQSQSDRYSTKDDERLAYQIRRQIAQVAPQYRDFILYIDKGDVKIMGKVPAEDVKIRIADAIKQVRGVKSVTNRLESD